MLKALESGLDLQSAQDRFAAGFDPYVESRYDVDIGYQGGYTRRQVLWMSSLDMWAHFGDPPSEKGPPTRFWNVFGLGRPSGMVSIACEINPPTVGKKYPPAGVFAEDEMGRLSILHRGVFTVTGGITITFIRRHIDMTWVVYQDRGNSKDAMLVAQIPSADYGESVHRFVTEVDRVKHLARERR